MMSDLEEVAREMTCNIIKEFEYVNNSKIRVILEDDSSIYFRIKDYDIEVWVEPQIAMAKNE